MIILHKLLQISENLTFQTAKGSTYIVTDHHSTIRNKAARPEHPNSEGKKEESQLTFYATDEDISKIGSVFQAMKIKKAIVTRQSQATIKWLDGPNAGKYNRETLINIKWKPEIGLIPVELWNNGEVVHFGNKIVAINYQ